MDASHMSTCCWQLNGGQLLVPSGLCLLVQCVASMLFNARRLVFDICHLLISGHLSLIAYLPVLVPNLSICVLGLQCMKQILITSLVCFTTRSFAHYMAV